MNRIPSNHMISANSSVVHGWIVIMTAEATLTDIVGRLTFCRYQVDIQVSMCRTRHKPVHQPPTIHHLNYYCKASPRLITPVSKITAAGIPSSNGKLQLLASPTPRSGDT